MAIDGSPASEVALKLAANLPWPPATTLLVLTVVHAVPRVISRPLPVTPKDAARIERQLQRAAARASRPAPRLRRIIAEGSPERVITDAARRLRAELIIMGSRGRGSVATTLLGSVTATTADRSRVPVLVARQATAERIVLADDGSPCASAAADWLTQSSLFKRATVRVASVAGCAEARDRSPSREALLQAQRIAHARQDSLEQAGMTAGAEVREGDPAGRILDVAGEWADLVVIGCRGRIGLTRLLLGSVARTVMTEAPCSVLVVKEPPCC